MSADTNTYQPAAIPDEGTATQVYRIVIKATPQEIWDAITLPEFTRRYFHGAAITITPDGYASFGPDGSSWGDAEVLEWDPPNRVVHGWTSLYDPTLAAEAESRVTWEITLRRRRHLPAHGDPRPARGRPAHRVRRRRSRLDGRPVGAQDPSGDGGAAAPDVRGGAGLTDAVTSARWCTHSCAACRTSHRTVRTSSGRRATVRSHASPGTDRTSSPKPCAAADSSARRTSRRVAAVAEPHRRASPHTLGRGPVRTSTDAAVDADREGEQDVPDVTRILDRRTTPPAAAAGAEPRRRASAAVAARAVVDSPTRARQRSTPRFRVRQSAGRAGVVLAEKGRQVAHGFSITSEGDRPRACARPRHRPRPQRARGEDEGVVDAILAADERRRVLTGRFERLRAEQKSFGKQVARPQGEEKQAAAVAQPRSSPPRSRTLRPRPTRREPSSTRCSARVGNIVIDGVPVGGEDDYVVSRPSARPATSPPRASSRATTSRWPRASDAIDMERGAKVVGRALLLPQGRRRAARAGAAEHGDAAGDRGGFMPMITPTLVKADDHGRRRLPRRPRGRGLPPRGRRPLPDRHLRGGARGLPHRRDPRPLRAVRSGTPGGRPATAARPAPTARTPAASSGCTSSTRSRCSSTAGPRTPRPSTSGCSGGRSEMLAAIELPYRDHRHRGRRPRRPRGAQVRLRGVGADPGPLPRADLDLELHDLPGPPARHP